jgi:arsenate reductase (glutaredoxin)
MIEYWHNPRCSKSRAGLTLLQEAQVEIAIRLYLQDPPSRDDLELVRAALGLPTIQMMRRGERRFKELGLSKDSDEASLLQAMIDNPILIERPIAIDGNRAVIGRPTEALKTLI